VNELAVAAISEANLGRIIACGDFTLATTPMIELIRTECLDCRRQVEPDPVDFVVTDERRR
jgi:hypothetical protein